MKKFLIGSSVIGFIVGVITVLAFALDVPALKGRVNDYAGIMSADSTKQAEAVSKQLEMTDSTQIAILTISSLQGDDIRNFGLKVFRSWKLGQKTTSTKTYDNGILITIAKNDRKWGVEVGRGLEGILPDIKSKEIMQEYFVPLAKQGKFGEGLVAAMSAMSKRVKGEFVPKNQLELHSGLHSK